MSTPYDYDVVVVGAGPAGLAAATRVRWVKGYHALAGSVCLVESGEPGGLLSWGSCVLTGPGWAYSGAELTRTLMQDIERLRVPLVRARVVAVERQGPLFCTTLDDGRSLRSLAVVLATGFRPLANEARHYQKGVRITFKGYEYFPSLLRACARDADGGGLVVIGNQKTAHLEALIDAHSAGSGEVTLVQSGRLVEVLGEARVEGVRVQEGEQIRTIACRAVLMDYNAFELSPSFDIAGLELARDSAGFVRADTRMQTSVDGVFVAGDLTGRYASTLIALGDGVCAGLSAYAYSFERKFGRAPNLFAYAASDRPLPANPVDLPQLPESAVPVALGDAPEWVDGQRTLSEYAAALELDVEGVRQALASAIATRDATVHHLHDGESEDV